MFRTLINAEAKFCQRILLRGVNTSSSTGTWDVLAGLCIERLPVVTPPLNDMQKKYKKLLDTIEIERSLKSDHEIRRENDKKQAELMKSESSDVDTVSKITAQDFEDAANEELAQFKFAPIETEADKKGDKTSTERFLQKHLVLVKQTKLGSDVKSILPQGAWREGETLRQTAERVLSEQCGDLQVQFYGNAPCGFYKYKYPKEVDGKVGAKVFFYYASYKGGATTKDKTAVTWLSRQELSETLPERYHKSVAEFLIDEAH
ncbi:unnamed protein product [Plutella xylostella]|uniref:Large ribosomal subunit protein mL46 n=1 Tax=Plutella xylostella TaxID=51655 RepID=A0A8S4EU70_PLUXY|nr:unnamed protein product [Plutella xylostella]